MNKKNWNNYVPVKCVPSAKMDIPKKEMDTYYPTKKFNISLLLFLNKMYVIYAAATQYE
ncbi:hypothetical protein GCM10010911_62730 [Paenibacillus nasutitermitis]|uniref:Uncharacterized protein n=1 Tax=Paenibacillus nasutitermitis TaxID=1652958 RepID=A0A917E1Q2_9BACL|nr:hypothetical protein GCM10010911_62730 [Paenibacillus nasutitermitis]